MKLHKYRDTFVDDQFSLTESIEQVLSSRQIGAELSIDEQLLFPRDETVGNRNVARRSSVTWHDTRSHQVRVKTTVNCVQFLQTFNHVISRPQALSAYCLHFIYTSNLYIHIISCKFVMKMNLHRSVICKLKLH